MNQKPKDEHIAKAFWHMRQQFGSSAFSEKVWEVAEQLEKEDEEKSTFCDSCTGPTVRRLCQKCKSHFYKPCNQ